MSEPATKADVAATKVELHAAMGAAVAPLATRVELHDAIADAIAPLATKIELHGAIAAAVAPLATKADLANHPTHAQLDHKLDLMLGAIMARFDEMDTRFSAEMGRHVRAVEESFRPQIPAVDDRFPICRRA